MIRPVRQLNPAGIAAFQAFIVAAKANPATPVPVSILDDPEYSEPFGFTAGIDTDMLQHDFQSAYDWAVYLAENVLAAAPKTAISRNAGLWNWLALCAFDLLCPITGSVRTADGILAVEAYVLDPRLVYSRAYRHLVRGPWLTYVTHGQFAQVMLKPISRISGPRALTVRTDIPMQLSATQAFVESRSIIEAAYRIYFDERAGGFRRGAGGSGAGSPRRLVAVLNQLDLTYDLHSASADTILKLLPREFDRFTRPEA